MVRRPSRDAVAARLAAARGRAETLPGGRLVVEVVERERDLGGGLIAGGVAFRVFLWLVPAGLVIAALLSFWSEHDEAGLERASREFGIGAAAAEAAADVLRYGDRNSAAVLVFALVFLAWFTLGAVRALVLAHALAWQLKPPRIRRPFRAIALFNGLFALQGLQAAGVAWLRAQLETTAILSVAITICATTAIGVAAMWLLPHRASSPRELLPGALLVAVGVQAVNVAVLFYFAPRLGRSEETYGAFGAAATMLVWLYVLSRLVTGAAFLNAILWEHSHRRNGSAAPAAGGPSATP
jgi:uncharacterized BrkB/YihY/UPF0761 family membrane protein